MPTIKVAAAALNQTPLDWQRNAGNICRAIVEAKQHEVDILCLPELCISGYGAEDAFLSPATADTAAQLLRELLPETGGIVATLGLPVWHMNKVFNATCLAVDGKLAGAVAKRYLAGDGVHYEPRWFKAWPEGAGEEIELAGTSCLLGDIYFRISGITLGLEICEDAWVPLRPGRALASRAVDIMLNPSASHFAFGKHEQRKHIVLDGSRSFGVTYIYANLLGCEAGRILYDGDCLIASNGHLLASGKRFSYEDVVLTHCTVDLDKTRIAQAGRAENPSNTVAAKASCISTEFDFKFAENSETTAPQVDNWETSSHLKKEEFARAVALGLHDYCRKSRAHGFVISLSGGADSSASACLVKLMLELSIKELGLKKFIERFDYIADLDKATSVADVVRQMLTCVYQATDNSSETTRNAACTVASSLQCSYHEFGIQPLVDNYVKMVSDGLGKKLTWQEHDLALQNIQARVRAPGIWLVANLRRAILLTTSNRSEAAVGYATMDGDTSGGLSPIGGIDKAFLRQWLAWMQADGPDGIGATPALAAVTAQQPTAELRPKSARQSDENDLMPYEVLDAIERLAIRDKKLPVQTFLHIRGQFRDKHKPGDLKNWVHKFYVLWSRNQWKRERYAPSFHLDDENLDPKTWCRFPILSGGFERELAALSEMDAD